MVEEEVVEEEEEEEPEEEAEGDEQQQQHLQHNGSTDRCVLTRDAASGCWLSGQRRLGSG